MIPKKIHYCWFGGNPKSRLIKKCLRSWKKYFPDYEIIEWNESNFDVSSVKYVQQAYEQKKWAFVSDYVRFYALNKYGGIYFDTDVQVLKPMDDLIAQGKFTGFASDEIVLTALIMATEKEDWLCQKILNSYENEDFVWDEDPSKILAIGRRVTMLLVDEGLKLDGSKQKVRDYTIYPQYYFNPTNGDMRVKVDERAYSIHHYAASWFTGIKQFKNTARRFIGSRNMERYYKVRSMLRNGFKR